MIIKYETYGEIIKELHQLIESGLSFYDYFISKSLSKEFEYNSLYSLYSQIFVRSIKKKTYNFDKETLISMYNRLESGENIQTVIKNEGYSIYKVVKMILDMLNIELSDFIETPHLIENEEVRYQLLDSLARDTLSSTLLDILKNSTGKEFECYLENRLSELKICFETESELRLQGKPKTPDILLLIPMKVKIFDEYFLINWIDSKGLFADYETYNENEQQLKGYVNRYGHGLVIYWYGFVENIPSEEAVVISDHFPETWIFPTGDIASLDESPGFDLGILSLDKIENS